jgi:hypothetical protein
MARCMRRAAAVIALLVALVAPATASGLVFTLHHSPFGSRTAMVERAMLFQLNHQVRPRWHEPVASFGPDGLPVYFYKKMAKNCGAGYAGCHDQYGAWVLVSTGTSVRRTSATAGISSGSSYDFHDEEVALSHELIESVVDPNPFTSSINGYIPEPCDVVGSDSYHGLDGVRLSDFIYPHWFVAGSRGPWDQTRRLTAPLQEDGSNLALTISGSSA